MNTSNGRHPARILVAEDDPDIKHLITLLLEFHGFQVDSASDGLQAVERARKRPYELFLLDVRMPGMTGYEVCEWLKQHESTRPVPVIFLSAKGQEAEIQAGLAAGAERYVLKPFAPDELMKTISEVLAASRS